MVKDYPLPIIFGAINKAHPFPQLNFQDIGGAFKVFSRTNYNLFVQAEERRNLSLKIFLNELDDVLRDAANQPRGESECNQCIRTGIPCRLYVKSFQEGIDIRFTSNSPEVVFRHVELWSKDEIMDYIPILNCALLQCLFKMTETEAELKFMKDYIRWVLFSSRSDDCNEDHVEIDLLQPIAQRLSTQTDYSPWKAKRDLDDIAFSTVPALIPQVWLNYIYDPHLGPKDPKRAYLRKNISRVDFIMLWEGMRHIIEIDGPEHYGSLKGGEYLVDQERYTKNLIVERSLRNLDWIVHRFSNLEVLNSKSFRFPFEDELGLHWFSFPWWRHLTYSQ